MTPTNTRNTDYARRSAMLDKLEQNAVARRQIMARIARIERELAAPRYEPKLPATFGLVNTPGLFWLALGTHEQVADRAA